MIINIANKFANRACDAKSVVLIGAASVLAFVTACVPWYYCKPSDSADKGTERTNSAPNDSCQTRATVEDNPIALPKRTETNDLRDVNNIDERRQSRRIVEDCSVASIMRTQINNLEHVNNINFAVPSQLRNSLPAAVPSIDISELQNTKSSVTEFQNSESSVTELRNSESSVTELRNSGSETQETSELVQENIVSLYRAPETTNSASEYSNELTCQESETSSNMLSTFTLVIHINSSTSHSESKNSDSSNTVWENAEGSENQESCQSDHEYFTSVYGTSESSNSSNESCTESTRRTSTCQEHESSRSSSETQKAVDSEVVRLQPELLHSGRNSSERIIGHREPENQEYLKIGKKNEASTFESPKSLNSVNNFELASSRTRTSTCYESSSTSDASTVFKSIVVEPTAVYKPPETVVDAFVRVPLSNKNVVKSNKISDFKIDKEASTLTRSLRDLNHQAPGSAAPMGNYSFGSIPTSTQSASYDFGINPNKNSDNSSEWKKPRLAMFISKRFKEICKNAKLNRTPRSIRENESPELAIDSLTILSAELKAPGGHSTLNNDQHRSIEITKNKKSIASKKNWLNKVEGLIHPKSKIRSAMKQNNNRLKSKGTSWNSEQRDVASDTVPSLQNIEEDEESWILASSGIDLSISSIEVFDNPEISFAKVEECANVVRISRSLSDQRYENPRVLKNLDVNNGSGNPECIQEEPLDLSTR